jgi:trk system potassium uptake protein TrkA
MNIIIVGCGKVGITLATQLGEDGNNITMIDLSSEKIKSITSRFDVMGVVGNGATHTTQKEAGIKKADLLIAVTDSDELNLLCCMIAKKNSKCEVIAKLQNPEYSSESEYLRKELGLAMVINPEMAAAEEIARLMRFPSATKIETFARGKVELIKFRIPDSSIISGMSVKDVMRKLRPDILMCTVERDDESFIVNGDFVLYGKDILSIIASPKNASEFFKAIGYKSASIKDAIIVGADEVTHYLCNLIQRSGISIKVIDSNLDRCEHLGARHPSITVINGDETDRDLLEEEGINDTDAFLSLSESDEENVILSLYAKSSGEKKIVTMINKPEYDHIVRNMELDTVIYPKDITADMIARYVRAMKNTRGSNMETMYNVIKGEVEASEFKISGNSKITGIPLCELKFKNDVLVAAIMRDNKVIIPRGYDVIEPGDAVVIVSRHLGLRDITDVLR